MTETNIPSTDRLTARNKWTYSLGGIGRDMAYSLYSTFLLSFILFTKQPTDAQFAVISVILIVCRIWDAINDPVMGSIIENTRSKFGKFKPWILIGVLSNSVILVLMFSLPLQGWAFVVAFAFMYLLWDITFTMNDIGYWAMLPALTSDPKGRATVTSMANLFAGIGAVVSVGLVPVFTAGDLAIGGNAVTAYAVVAAFIAAVFIGCQVMTVIGVQEKVQPVDEKKERIGLKKMVKVIFNNKPLCWVTISMLLYNLGSALILGFGTNYVYLEFGYNGLFVTAFVAVYAVSSGLVNVFYPALENKLSRKSIQALGIGIACLGYLIFFFTGIIWPMNIIALCAGLLLIGFGQSMFYMVLTISISNTVEYNEWKFGSRDEGIIFSLRPFMAKMGSAFQQLVIMIVYLAVGLTAITNEISAVENSAAAGNITDLEKASQIATAVSKADSSMKIILRACMVFLPIILLALAYLVLRTKYTIDEKTYAQIMADLDRRHKEAHIDEVVIQPEIDPNAKGQE